jgi:predicted nucleic acid-binding Zn ribbon protein
MVLGQVVDPSVARADPLILPSGISGGSPSRKSRVLGIGSHDFDVSVFKLPSHGKASAWCGEIRLRDCRNVAGHDKTDLDEVNWKGRYVIELYRASCGKISCPIDYEKAIAKMAIKVEWKFRHLPNVAYVKHVVASVPAHLYHLGAKKLRILAIAVFKDRGLADGMVIYHPWRQKCAQCGAEVETLFGEKVCVECGSPFTIWVYEPHHHSIGCGKIIGSRVKAGYEKDGWVVKNFGIRKSIRATIQYQLSHCGVADGFSNIVWFGKFAHPKHAVPPLPAEKHDCPICGQGMGKPLLDPFMVRLMKSGYMDNLKEGFYSADPEMFDYWDPWNGDGG